MEGKSSLRRESQSESSRNNENKYKQERKCFLLNLFFIVFQGCTQHCSGLTPGLGDPIGDTRSAPSLLTCRSGPNQRENVGREGAPVCPQISWTMCDHHRVSSIAGTLGAQGLSLGLGHGVTQESPQAGLMLVGPHGWLM